MRTHVVQFSGFFKNPSEFPDSYKEYGDVTNEEYRLEDNTKMYVSLVNDIIKDKLKIVDFGGGQGGHYLTLKQETKKELTYHIVERPESFNDVDNEVQYHTSLDIEEKDIDILYSNGVIYMTKGITAPENIHAFCHLNPDSILLQRTIVSEDGEYDHFYTRCDQFGGTYYNIISQNYLIEICESYGYELVYVEYQRPEAIKFKVNKSPEDIGLICYKNFLFKKKYE